MNISIDNRHAERLRHKVESGSYPTLDAAVDMALTLLDERDERRSLAEDALRAKIEEGVDAARSGDYADYTEERAVLQRLVARPAHSRLNIVGQHAALLMRENRARTISIIVALLRLLSKRQHTITGGGAAWSVGRRNPLDSLV